MRGLRFPEESSKAVEKEPESETSYGCNHTVALGLGKGLAVLDGECYLVMPLRAVAMHQVELKILAGFLTRQLCQILYHTNVPTALLSWKCWKEVTLYAGLIHVLSPVFHFCGLVQVWGEKILKWGWVLGRLKCWEAFVASPVALAALPLSYQLNSELL